MKVNLSEWSTFAANDALLSHDVTEYAMLPVQRLLAWNSFIDDLEETNGSALFSYIAIWLFQQLFNPPGRLFPAIYFISCHLSSNMWVFHRFGDTVLSSGWGGHTIPSGSFTSGTYLWIRFTTNGGNSDGRFHAGWTGTYQKYWPYVSV